MRKKRIRLQPAPHTSIVVSVAGSAMKVEVAAIGLDDGENGGDGEAARLRVVADVLRRYADGLDPLYVEDLGA